MSDAVVMVTVADRLAMLNQFLASFARHVGGMTVLVHVQGGDPAQWRRDLQVPKGVEVGHVMHSHAPLGCHAARVELLRRAPRFERYVNVDDDVELVEQTNWGPALDHATEPGVGFVLTNWVRHPNALPDAVARLSERFVPQVMVYQGGGMAYTDEVADLMRELDPVPARYDDLWPLTAYLEGRRNYRYLGSIAVHRIMQKGGMNQYMRQEPRPLLAGKWVVYPHLPGQRVGMDYGIPMDKDLRPIAVEKHHENRAAKGWPAHRGRA